MRAVVLCPCLRKRNNKTARSTYRSQSQFSPGQAQEQAPEARLLEAEGLARAIDLNICHSGLVFVASPRPATLFGSGKVEELHGLISSENAEIVIIDHPLTPVQQRNLEKAWNVKVLDRAGLILEIFGKRARTREGRLQVELAHLTYQKSRLVRSWTHLERQRGGHGFLGGPGERQIESDRRMIQNRISDILREIETVKKTRKLHRESRAKVPYPVVALVGYTNAGKSTLFNVLTGENVMAEDILFATLDPTMREIRLPGGSRIILSDTVGFISGLPTALVAAFRATLEEVVEADLILLVRDIADEDSEAQLSDVLDILEELEIDTGQDNTRLIEVWNKTDLLDDSRLEELKSMAIRRSDTAVCISAHTGDGISALLENIRHQVNASHVTLDLTIAPGEGSTANWLHENSEIIHRIPREDGLIDYRVRLSEAKQASLARRLGREPELLQAGSVQGF